VVSSNTKRRAQERDFWAVLGLSEGGGPPMQP
jgi:hypothetical protein